MDIKPKSIIPDQVVGTRGEKLCEEITHHEAILYALGIGFN